VLSFWQAQYPRDDRPALAIAVARRYARGEATDAEQIAAGAAAWYAEHSWQTDRLWQYLRGEAR